MNRRCTNHRESSLLLTRPYLKERPQRFTVNKLLAEPCAICDQYIIVWILHFRVDFGKDLGPFAFNVTEIEGNNNVAKQGAIIFEYSWLIEVRKSWKMEVVPAIEYDRCFSMDQFIDT